MFFHFIWAKKLEVLLNAWTAKLLLLYDTIWVKIEPKLFISTQTVYTFTYFPARHRFRSIVDLHKHHRAAMKETMKCYFPESGFVRLPFDYLLTWSGSTRWKEWRLNSKDKVSWPWWKAMLTRCCTSINSVSPLSLSDLLPRLPLHSSWQTR